MKSLFALLLIATTFSCSKDKEDEQRKGPLDSVPEAKQIGPLEVVLTADKSRGPVAKWGWAATIWTEVQLSAWNEIKWSPNMSNEKPDFFPVTAKVPKVGKYNFSLIVYDNAGNQNFDTVSIVVK